MGKQRPSDRAVSRILLTLPVVILALPGAGWAQEHWRGLNVPRYPNATDYSVRTDEDEYDIHFRSQDDVQGVFDFYRHFLEQQGFRVTESKPKSNGFKAEMVRGQGGPDNRVELDAKLKKDRYKVEIEFDD